mmetsp:Transcript_23026/g.78750  ORF Transcript_23026/g.78750 Transcript_23026/m.78750 type:complete len:205 (+) Transcript_23026:1951-2565(+)
MECYGTSGREYSPSESGRVALALLLRRGPCVSSVRGCSRPPGSMERCGCMRGASSSSGGATCGGGGALCFLDFFFFFGAAPGSAGASRFRFLRAGAGARGMQLSLLGVKVAASPFQPRPLCYEAVGCASVVGLGRLAARRRRPARHWRRLEARPVQVHSARVDVVGQPLEAALADHVLRRLVQLQRRRNAAGVEEAEELEEERR